VDGVDYAAWAGRDVEEYYDGLQVCECSDLGLMVWGEERSESIMAGVLVLEVPQSTR
jgi:hypothetical protein